MSRVLKCACGLGTCKVCVRRKSMRKRRAYEKGRARVNGITAVVRGEPVRFRLTVDDIFRQRADQV